ncbi:hypothetical protein GPJ56_003819 [Histomonas meleagridis]|uniref:uncharacterized protein n=1 Tax=Histomonas meleagridis TaxID=135588 RepID=UPI003559B28D|nr:hypothetical protein GPJ56_003819 [Histomonas meleagridis]KAH0805277.1 hypothetical protein GO595_002222 [Histomonas meleagridis]
MEKEQHETNQEKLNIAKPTIVPSLSISESVIVPKENPTNLSQNPQQQNTSLQIPKLNLSGLSPGSFCSSNTRKPSFPQFNQNSQGINGQIPPLNLNAKPAHIKALGSDPTIPPLNLSLVSTPRNNTPILNQPSRSISIGALGDQAELDLAQISTETNKRERHDVLLCIPYYVFSTKSELESFTKLIPCKFGEGSEITQVSNFPIDTYVIEGAPNSGAPRTIPSLQNIDAAYQNIENIPFLIDQTTKECTLLTSHIEQTLERIEDLRNEREKQKIENALLKERIKVAKQRQKSSGSS